MTTIEIELDQDAIDEIADTMNAMPREVEAASRTATRRTLNSLAARLRQRLRSIGLLKFPKNRIRRGDSSLWIGLNRVYADYLRDATSVSAQGVSVFGEHVPRSFVARLPGRELTFRRLADRGGLRPGTQQFFTENGVVHPISTTPSERLTADITDRTEAPVRETAADSQEIYRERFTNALRARLRGKVG